MIALESDVPANRIEESPQHEAQCLRIGDFATPADPHELRGDLFCTTLVANVLGFQAADGFATGRTQRASPLECREQDLFLVPMRFAQQGQQGVGDLNAFQPIEAIG